MSEAGNDRETKRVGALRLALSLLLFFAIWLLWSGHYEPLVVVLGLIASVLVLLFARRAGFFEASPSVWRLVPRLPRYWLWLIREVTKASLEVTRIVLHPRLPISPCMVTIDASDLPPLVQTTLANAITLTAGTVTVDVADGRIEVHCLTREFAANLERGEMYAKARELSGD